MLGTCLAPRDVIGLPVLGMLGKLGTERGAKLVLFGCKVLRQTFDITLSIRYSLSAEWIQVGKGWPSFTINRLVVL